MRRRGGEGPPVLWRVWVGIRVVHRLAGEERERKARRSGDQGPKRKQILSLFMFTNGGVLSNRLLNLLLLWAYGSGTSFGLLGN